MLAVKRKEVKQEARTDFEKQAVKIVENVLEKAKKEKKVDALKVVRKLMSLFFEHITEEFNDLIADSVNVTTKRKLYGSPDKALQLFTVIESRRKPEGYFISLQLARKLPKDTELRQLFSVLNILSLNAYNLWNLKKFCGEEEQNDRQVLKGSSD